MAHKHPHYLRSFRRLASLSQRDVAFLLGVKAISKISRYERNVTLPPIITALAYEAISGKPVGRLFEGTYDRIRAIVRQRAAELLKNTPRTTHSAQATRRKQSLQSIARR
jgi:transcriptional regulator with XRE-family HTH domain